MTTKKKTITLKRRRIVRSAHSPRKRVTLKFTKPSLAKQSFKDECDINNILASFQKTGVITHLNSAQPNYGLASSMTFTESQQIIATAKSAFADLPATIREKFGHNPNEFLKFVEDPDNRLSLANMGLLSPEASKIIKDRLEAKPDPSETPLNPPAEPEIPAE